MIKIFKVLDIPKFALSRGLSTGCVLFLGASCLMGGGFAFSSRVMAMESSVGRPPVGNAPMKGASPSHSPSPEGHPEEATPDAGDDLKDSEFKSVNEEGYDEQVREEKENINSFLQSYESLQNSILYLEACAQGSGPDQNLEISFGPSYEYTLTEKEIQHFHQTPLVQLAALRQDVEELQKEFKALYFDLIFDQGFREKKDFYDTQLQALSTRASQVIQKEFLRREKEEAKAIVGSSLDLTLNCYYPEDNFFVDLCKTQNCTQNFKENVEKSALSKTFITSTYFNLTKMFCFIDEALQGGFSCLLNQMIRNQNINIKLDSEEEKTIEDLEQSIYVVDRVLQGLNAAKDLLSSQDQEKFKTFYSPWAVQYEEMKRVLSLYETGEYLAS